MELESEFRQTYTLYPLFYHYEYWDKISDIISKGVSYSLNDPTEKERRDDIKHMIS